MKMRKAFVIWALTQVTLCAYHLAKENSRKVRLAEERETMEAISLMEAEGGIVVS